jgi:hypothetical protein
MKTKIRIVVAALAGLVSLAAAPAWAQVAEGQAYGEAREALLRQGWKPNVDYGLKMANGKPLYHYPEVLCGPQVCKAKWRDAQGKERAFMLTRGVGQDHRIGPQP